MMPSIEQATEDNWEELTETLEKEETMKDSLTAGVEYTHRYRVPEEKTVPFLFPEAESFQAMPRVLATGFLVGLMEWACIEAMAPYLDEGEGSVGTRIDITHSAPTPPGMEVTVQVRCVEVDGRLTTWEIEATDETEAIGKAIHQRFTVNWDKFNARLEGKGR